MNARACGARAMGSQGRPQTHTHTHTSIGLHLLPLPSTHASHPCSRHWGFRDVRFRRRYKSGFKQWKDAAAEDPQRLRVLRESRGAIYSKADHRAVCLPFLKFWSVARPCVECVRPRPPSSIVYRPNRPNRPAARQHVGGFALPLVRWCRSCSRTALCCG